MNHKIGDTKLTQFLKYGPWSQSVHLTRHRVEDDIAGTISHAVKFWFVDIYVNEIYSLLLREIVK